MSSPPLVVAWLLLATAGGPPPDAAPLLVAADAARHVLEEGVLGVRVRVEEQGRPPVQQDLDVYVRGSERALCVFRDGAQRGRKVLCVGSRVWLLVPGTAN